MTRRKVKHAANPAHDRVWKIIYSAFSWRLLIVAGLLSVGFHGLTASDYRRQGCSGNKGDGSRFLLNHRFGSELSAEQRPLRRCDVLDTKRVEDALLRQGSHQCAGAAVEKPVLRQLESGVLSKAAHLFIEVPAAGHKQDCRAERMWPALFQFNKESVNNDRTMSLSADFHFDGMTSSGQAFQQGQVNPAIGAGLGNNENVKIANSRLAPAHTTAKVDALTRYSRRLQSGSDHLAKRDRFCQRFPLLFHARLHNGKVSEEGGKVNT